MNVSIKKQTAALGLVAILGALASNSCVGSREPTPEQSSAIEKLVLAEAPSDITRLDIALDDKVTLLGYKMTPHNAVKPGERVKFTLYWKSEKPIGEAGWSLFTHILSDKNKKLLNIDNIGPLRDNGKKPGQLHPPSAWEAGKVYVDEQSFRVPKQARGTSIRIVTGVWKGKNRLKVQSGPDKGSDRAVIATLNVSGSAPTEVAKSKVPELRVDKLEKGQSIKIDGKLDDSAWEMAPSSGSFVNVSSGAPVDSGPVQGRARLLWDEKHLYLGFEVTDKDIVGTFEKNAKDPHLWTKDCVEIMIDPDGDGDNKDYYEIQVNPQNLVFDSQFDDYNLPKGGENGPFGNQDWSAKLTSAVVVNGTLDKSEDEDQGYSVEIQIPWASFGKAKQAPPELGQTWRVNLYAMQNNGGVAWSPILKQGNFHKASRFGRVLWASKDWAGPAADSPQAAAAVASAPSGESEAAGGAKATPPATAIPEKKVQVPKPPKPKAPQPAASVAP